MMSNINGLKKAFLRDNGIKSGTKAWRAYLNDLGFTGHSIVMDTKYMLVSGGYWTGNMNESLAEYYTEGASSNIRPTIVVTALDFTQGTGTQVGDDAGTYITHDDDVGDILTVTFNVASDHYDLDTGNEKVTLTSDGVFAIESLNGLDAINLKVTDDGDVPKSGTDSDTPVVSPEANVAPVIDVTANDFVQNSGNAVGDVAGVYAVSDANVQDTLTVTFNTASTHYTLNESTLSVEITSAALTIINAAGTLDAIDLKVTDDGVGNLTDTDSDTPLVSPEAGSEREVYTPDGVDDVIVGPVNMINMQTVPHVLIKFNAIDAFSGQGAICSQNISTSQSAKAFQFDTDPSDGSLFFTHSGVKNTITSFFINGDHQYKVDWTNGGRILAYRDDILIVDQGLVRGFNYEPTAKFKVLARSANSIDSVGWLCDFVVYDFSVYNFSSFLANLAIDDGWAANPTIVNTGTGGTFTATDFQEGGWEGGVSPPIVNNAPTITVTANNFTQNNGDASGDEAGTYVTYDADVGDTLTVTFNTASTHYTLDTGTNSVELTTAGVAVINADGQLDAIDLKVTDDGTPNLSGTDSDTPVITGEGGGGVDPDTGFPLLPWYASTSVWNQEIGVNPTVDVDSAAMIADLVSKTITFSPNFSFHQHTIPIYFTDESTPLKEVIITGDWASTFYSMPNVPIPVDAVPDAESDQHICLIDRNTGFEWNMWKAVKDVNGDWSTRNIVGRAGIYGNTSDEDGTYKKGVASRASSICLAAGVIHPSELNGTGTIEHAMICAYPGNRPWGDPRGYYFFPATSSDYNGSRTDGVPQGAHLQLNPALDVDDYPALLPYERKIFIALQKYGMYNSDFAGALVIYGLNRNCRPTDPYDGDLGFSGNWGPMNNIPWNEMRVLELPQFVAVSRTQENKDLYILA
jgi:hypothetical protein